MSAMAQAGAIIQIQTWAGDMVQSVFKRSARMLRRTTFQAALRFVAGRKDMERYQDMLDFLFCELFVEYQAACLKYYAGEGPKLRDAIGISKAMLTEWDLCLVISLHVAHEAHRRNQRLAWKEFRGRLMRALGTCFRRDTPSRKVLRPASTA